MWTLYVNKVNTCLTIRKFSLFMENEITVLGEIWYCGHQERIFIRLEDPRPKSRFFKGRVFDSSIRI